jgi:hypothetical protein
LKVQQAEDLERIKDNRINYINAIKGVEGLFHTLLFSCVIATVFLELKTKSSKNYKRVCGGTMLRDVGGGGNWLPSHLLPW